ncbi:hypothetical protein ISS86_02880 [Candidatus Microgenomates bacterium]|nr:hypothetical protein [Candidatus Microgenomates bacterium]
MKLPFFKKKDEIEGVKFKPKEILLEDIIAPSLIEVSQNYLKLGERLCKTFFVFSYPRYLSTGWMSAAINLNYPLDISFHIHPVNSGQILRKLRKKITEVQAELIERANKGLIRDPTLETAYKDIESLRDSLQTAKERVFRIGVYITIYGDTQKELREIEIKLRSIFESRLIYLKPTLLREKQGFTSTAPYGLDQILVHTPMNTEPLSSIFPFISPDLSSNEGILYGLNRHNNSLVLFDRFSLENANTVCFAKAGAGKSVKGSEQVLVKDKSKTQLTKIGPLIEKIVKKQGIDFRDKELEGKTFPGIKVWTFDKNLKGRWGEVEIAARKKAPKTFYKFKTKSGREITTTGDHNLVVLKDGKVITAKSSEVNKGEFIPLPREISFRDKSALKFLNLLILLKNLKNVYVKGGARIIQENYNFLKKVRINENLDRYLYIYRVGRPIPIHYFCQIKKKLKLDLNKNIDSLSLVSRLGKGELPASFKVSDEFLKILGYIASEGVVYKNFVGISNLDKAVIRDIELSLKKLKVSSFKTKKSINISTTVFVKTVNALGSNGKSKEKRVCPFIFNLNKEQVAKYLSTYFEGDGGIESHAITAVSKSKKLISDIIYLLLYFGIVGRISKANKKPTNCNWKRKRTYWKLTISGQDNLQKFSNHINFISQRKKCQLKGIIKKNGNTNVDFIPELDLIFQEIYQLISPQLYNILEISEWKRGIRHPSPQHLLRVVDKIEERIQKFRDLAPNYRILSGLPSFNAFKAIAHTSEENFTLGGIKKILYQGFKEMGLPYCNLTIKSALKTRPESNTRYEIIQRAAQFVWHNYQDILINKIPIVEEKLNQLKVLANSHLFWDPIIEIKKIENKNDKYVYDLTCENGVFLAGNGGMFIHNSYALKLEVLRYLMQDVNVIIIDPENEYEFLSDAVDGSYFKISLSSTKHLNPFDLPKPREDEELKDVLRSNTINLVGLFRIMLGGLTAEEDGIIDQAITETYAAKDITPDTNPEKWMEKIPVMSDFETVLEGMEGTQSLLERVRKFTTGSYSEFFNNPSNISMDKNLIVFGIRDMEDELRPMAMFIILRYIWNTIRSELRKRILLVDEAWWIMQTEDGASFLYGICKRARKYWLGVSTITQDVSDFMKSDYGKPIITNSSLQFLMKQSPAAVDIVQKTFNLTEEEKYILLECDVGEGIFIAGQKRVALKVVASYTEDQIITSSPEEVKKIKAAKKKLSQ